jgi:hypothetical protein
MDKLIQQLNESYIRLTSQAFEINEEIKLVKAQILALRKAQEEADNGSNPA